MAIAAQNKVHRFSLRKANIGILYRSFLIVPAFLFYAEHFSGFVLGT